MQSQRCQKPIIRPVRRQVRDFPTKAALPILWGKQRAMTDISNSLLSGESLTLSPKAGEYLRYSAHKKRLSRREAEKPFLVVNGQ